MCNIDMDKCSRLLFLLLLYKSYDECNGQVSHVRLNAPTQVRYKLDKLVLVCTPQYVANSDSISDIVIQKNSSTGWRNVVKVVSDTSTGTLEQKVAWTNTNLQSRASVTTAIVAPSSQAGLQIEIAAVNVACSDDGTYRCEITGNMRSGGKLDSQSNHGQVSMKVEPLLINPISVHPTQPDNKYNPNTILTLTCNGDVGSPPHDLRWCIKKSGKDIVFTGYPDASDITQGPASISDCQYRRTSTLRYNVSGSFDQVDFRCETGGVTLQCGHSSAIAANFTMFRSKEPHQEFASKAISVPNAAVLSCDIAKVIPQTVRWFKNREELMLSSNGRFFGGTSAFPDLVIKPFLKEDEGHYYCEMSNGYQVKTTGTIYLTLNDNSSYKTATIILGCLLSLVFVVIGSVLLFMMNKKYFVQKKDRLYQDAGHKNKASDHVYDKTDYHMYDTST